jgi:hypothetical protein
LGFPTGRSFTSSPPRQAGYCNKSFLCRFLLVNSHRRRERYSQKVQSLSAVRISTTRASSRTTADTTSMAFRTMGSRHGSKITQILAKRACLHVGGSRQIYLMGRSSPSNNPRFHSSNQFHQVYSILIWSAAQHHHRQWDKLHIKRVQELL